jgi:hypothetical protein
MALVPKIDICIKSKCDKIDVYEKTGPYDATNNVEGWINSGSLSGHIDTSEISAAELRIFDFSQTTLYDTIILYDGVIDVYSGITGAPTPASFLAIEDYEWEQGDGIFKLVYIIESSSDEGPDAYTNDTQHKLFICNLKNCLNSLKAKAVTECDGQKLKKIKEKIDQLEIIIYGIESAFSCEDWNSANELIATGTLICENLCDCGCGDC